jgi:hypothetical protein
MMADWTGSLYQPSTAGPSGRTIVGLVASYLASYLLLGFFLVLEQIYAGRAYQATTGAPGMDYIDRPHDGLYVIIVTLMMFVPVVVGGLMLGWITGRRSVAPAILLAVLYVITGLVGALWEFPSSVLVGWDVPHEDTITPVLSYYAGYLILLSTACTVSAAYLASRIRNRVSPVSPRHIP